MKGVPRGRSPAKFETTIKIRQRFASGLIVAHGVSDKAREFVGQEPAYGGAPLGGEHARFPKKILLDRDGNILLHDEVTQLGSRRSRVARKLRANKAAALVLVGRALGLRGIINQDDTQGPGVGLRKPLR
jgi:hypothetical protein